MDREVFIHFFRPGCLILLVFMNNFEVWIWSFIPVISVLKESIQCQYFASIRFHLNFSVLILVLINVKWSSLEALGRDVGLQFDALNLELEIL